MLDCEIEIHTAMQTPAIRHIGQHFLILANFSEAVG
jgi:hypothetical protein